MSLDYKIPYHRLRIDISGALQKDFDPEQLRRLTRDLSQPVSIWLMQAHKIKNYLDPGWLQYMADIGLPIQAFLLFYRQPNLEYPEVHTDLAWSNSKENPSKWRDRGVGLNWVLSSTDDSVMTWYDVPNHTGKLSTTECNSAYCFWPLDEVRHKEFARVSIGDQLTLVRTGIPHNIITHSRPRWSISLRLANPSQFDCWEDTVDYFDQKGLLLDAVS